MTITVKCSRCQAQYRVSDGLAGKTVKCTACQSPIRVAASPPRAEARPPNGSPGDGQKPTWWARNPAGQKFGPFTKEQLDRSARDGPLEENWLVLQIGWEQWRYAAEVYPITRAGASRGVLLAVTILAAGLLAASAALPWWAINATGFDEAGYQSTTVRIVHSSLGNGAFSLTQDKAVRCDGWETEEGLIAIGGGLLIAVLAVVSRPLPNLRLLRWITALAALGLFLRLAFSLLLQYLESLHIGSVHVSPTVSGGPCVGEYLAVAAAFVALTAAAIDAIVQPGIATADEVDSQTAP